MAGASAEGELNHWPAFVDVLTTVIMVVTFLLVIMSAAVMTLSQRAMQTFKEQLLSQEKQKQDKTKSHDAAVAGADGKSSAGSPGQQDNRLASPDAETGTSIAELGSILRQETPVDGEERLTIRTRATEDSLKLKVKAIEEADNSKGVEVQTADVLMRVDFEPSAVSYDADNSGKVTAFLKGRMRPGMKYEIWSFAPQASSVSEAQRVAFYRAAMTSNVLIKAGIAPADILTQIRVTDATSKDGHHVRVVLKP